MAILATALILSSALQLTTPTEMTGRVTQVRADANGRGRACFFSVSVGPAACGNPYPKCLAFTLTTEGGRAMFSTALSAKVSGLPALARGTGSCTHYPQGSGEGTEDMVHLWIVE